MKFSDVIGFCNHCGTFDVPVRTPWSHRDLALCALCYVRFCEAQDEAAAMFRYLRARGENVNA